LERILKIPKKFGWQGNWFFIFPQLPKVSAALIR